MKINGIIREKRLENKLTQEQVAAYLGVTAPAVNKWEKGVSFPDITLLSPLARLLRTDLNTLLAFQEELSEQEIWRFLEYLSGLFDREGFQKAYEVGMEKVREYPNCYELTLQTALTLEGLLMMSAADDDAYDTEREEIEGLYRRAMKSEEANISSQAKSILISKHIGRKDYDKAQELLDTLPEQTTIDRKRIQTNLLIARGEIEEAGRLAEEKLLLVTQEIQGTLLTMLEIAVKGNKRDQAEYIANTYKNIAQSLDWWEYGMYSADLMFHMEYKEWDQFLDILEKMLEALHTEWRPGSSLLYQYKEFHATEDMSGKLQEILLNGLRQDKELDELRENPRFQKILEGKGIS